MKKIILLVLMLSASVCSAQQITDITDSRKWEEYPLTLTAISYTEKILTERISIHTTQLSNNYISKSKNSVDYATVTYKYPTNDKSIVCFDIDDIHYMPNNEYELINDKWKSKYVSVDIYWGISLSAKGLDGKNYSYTFTFVNPKSKFDYYSSYYGHIASNVYGNSDLKGNFDRGWQNSRMTSMPGYIHIEHKTAGVYIMFRASKYGGFSETNWLGGIGEILSIKFLLGPAAKIKVSCSKYVETKASKYVDYIDEGDRAMTAAKNYMAAVNHYSKAIQAGCNTYDIYLKRAKAYLALEFYNNAIDDLSLAIKHRGTEEAYLLRGKIKLLKSDITAIEDLRKGGPEGLALVREIEAESSDMTLPNGKYTASGSGIIISANGVIATNYHVIENAKGIDILINRNGQVETYNAKVLISDKTNDLSLLKISSTNFTKFTTLPYSINTKLLDIGTSVFTLGYPMSNVLGEDVKLTDGLISSKTGYQGDLTTYQISAPIQPGSSGGPLFDKNGNLVGITNAGIPNADNVGYAIKISYLTNLIDAAPETIIIPKSNTISQLTLTEKVKRLSPWVVLIKVY